MSACALCVIDMLFLTKTYSSPELECYSLQTCLELINDLKKAVRSYMNLRFGFGLDYYREDRSLTFPSP
jgi:hypothetical protein